VALNAADDRRIELGQQQDSHQAASLTPMDR
jgi:hypothetical protein